MLLLFFRGYTSDVRGRLIVGQYFRINFYLVVPLLVIFVVFGLCHGRYSTHKEM